MRFTRAIHVLSWGFVACTILPAGAQAPSVPELGAVVRGTVVTLSWRPPRAGPTPKSYVLEVGSARGLSDLLVLETTSTTLQANAPIGTYYVRVRARTDAVLSEPSATRVVRVPYTCDGRALPTYVNYSLDGQSLVLSLDGHETGTRAAHNFIIEAGSYFGGADIARLNIPAQGFSTDRMATVAPIGGFFLRAFAQNPCGTSTASNETLLLIGDVLPGTATGHWRGFVNAPCAGLQYCPQDGYMGWVIEMDVAHIGTTVFGTYYYAAVDYGLAPASWGAVGGTLSPSGTLQLKFVAYGPPQSFGPNPGGTMSGTLSHSLDRLDATLFPASVTGIPPHNPTFVITKQKGAISR